MSDLYLITPPDKIYNQNSNLFLINPAIDTKNELQEILESTQESWNVYLYEETNLDEYITWLLDVHRMSDVTIIDIDNVKGNTRDIVSYLISFTNTYWRSKGENILYNKLSSTRFWHCRDITKLHKVDSEL